MTDAPDSPDDPIVIESPYTAEELAEVGPMYGCTGMGHTTLYSSWFTWFHDEFREPMIDPAEEAPDQSADRSRINPLDMAPSDEEPSDGGDR